jgi:radical SAM-linked protein
MEGVKSVFENEWTVVKLYFIVGLPTETEDDIQGIIDMVKQVSHLARAMGGKKNINVTISPFCPKPGTPWQWEEQFGIERITEIYKKLSSGLKTRNVSLKFHDPHLSVIEGILGRGDRRMSKVIIMAYHNGARLDGWSEHFSFDAWNNAFISSGHNIGDLLKAKSIHDTLPWEHIKKSISKNFLLDERKRSFNGKPPLGADKVRVKSNIKAMVDYGRLPRKRVAVTVMPAKTKIRMRYSRDERLRFYSHLDIIRAFHRAIRRAGLPASFSQGFHPHMKLSFGPPLAVGYISEAEYLDIQLDSPFEKKSLAALNDNLPPGLQITASKLIFSKTESLSKIINCASYLVETGDIGEDLQTRIEGLLKNREITVTRIRNGKTEELSAGRFLHDLTYNDSAFEMLLGFTSEGNLRPSEVLIFGLGFSPSQALPLIYKRTGQFLYQGVHKIDPLDMV